MKELNVRIVDQETKSYNSSPRPSLASKRLETQVKDLNIKLEQALQEKSDLMRAGGSSNQAIRDVQFQLAESERAKLRLETDMKNYEQKMAKLRDAMDDLVSSSLLFIVPISDRTFRSKPLRENCS